MKPILVGEMNPYGADPAFALYPAPEGSAGERLCCDILQMYRRPYLEAFERVNLCVGRWTVQAARDAARCIVGDPWTGPSSQTPELKRIILLGSKVCDAFGVPFNPFEWVGFEDFKCLRLPHPSGRCRLWQQYPDSLEKARNAVRIFCPEVAHLIGTAYQPTKQG